MKKRILSIVLVLCMLVSLVPAAALATVLLWIINNLFPLIIGTFIVKNT